MDVVVPYQCGVHNLVACMSTALTEEHLEQLKLITKRLVYRSTCRRIRAATVSRPRARRWRRAWCGATTGLIRYEEQPGRICILVRPMSTR